MSAWQIPCGRSVLHIGMRTLVMGILNVTPDSFSDGGRFLQHDVAVEHAWRMVTEGADIIDIGGESTRPGHEPVSTALEIERIVPVIRRLRAEQLPVPISVDTSKAVVAEAALAEGAAILNDIWGLQADPALAGVVARYRVPVVLMHNQTDTRYRNLMSDMASSLRQSIALAEAAGLGREYLMIDPGIGFGKTAEQNLDVLRDLRQLTLLGRPILVGTSRKSTIGKVLGGLAADERVEGTAATVAIAIANGADIVRVHDVKAMVRVARMTDAIVRPGRGGWRSE